MDSGIKYDQCNDIVDRISNLPAHVAHHILSFLTMEDLARLCLTSRRYRELCISIPFLTFDGIQYKSWEKRVKFINFLDRFISLRKRMETRRVSIRWPLKKVNSDEGYRVLTWLDNAIRCRVQFLDLDFFLNKEVFCLPLAVFHSESLMDLKVNLRGGILKLPSPDVFCKLWSLSLKCVEIFNQNFGEWISSFCKNLKELSLIWIRGIKNISIRSSSLQVLTIMTPWSENDLCSISISAEMLENMHLQWRFDSPAGRSFKIFTPKLVKFTWDGCIVSRYCLGNLKHLQYADIEFTPHVPSNRDELSCNQRLFDLLHGIRTVKVLYLHRTTIKFLFKQGCLLTLALHNLHDLYIVTSNLRDDLVPAIACLLKGTPNLKALSIRHPKYSKIPRNLLPFDAYGFTSGYWESQNLAFVQQLKVATIEIFNTRANELEFIKFLLKHATVLEKMTVFDPPHFSSEIGKVVNDYEKVSSAEVVFTPKPCK